MVQERDLEEGRIRELVRNELEKYLTSMVRYVTMKCVGHHLAEKLGQSNLELMMLLKSIGLQNEQIARLLGVHRVSVSRYFASLRSEFLDNPSESAKTVFRGLGLAFREEFINPGYINRRLEEALSKLKSGEIGDEGSLP